MREVNPRERYTGIRYDSEIEAREAAKGVIKTFRSIGMPYTVRVERVRDMANDFYQLRLYRK